jgi:hypothetical protein
MRYRVNTPEPSFPVEADSLNQATAIAVGKGFPVNFSEGDQVVSFERTRGGRVMRYVHLYRPRTVDGRKSYGQTPDTGFVIYEEG